MLFSYRPVKCSKSKNGELQNYTHEIRLFFNHIEDAIIAVGAIQHLVTAQESKIASKPYEPSSVKKAIEDVKSLLLKVTIGENSFDSFIEVSDTNPYTLKATTVFSNLKKSEENIQEFAMAEINSKNCNIIVKGKHVMAELNTHHLEKVVKTYVDGQIKPYQYKVLIETKGIEEARQIVEILKNTIEKFK